MNSLSNVNSQDVAGLFKFYGTIGHSLTPVFAFTSSFLILIILVLVLVIWGRFMGYGPFIGGIAALYIAYALYVAFPYANYLPSAPALTAIAAHVALFIGFFVLGYIVMRRVSASDFIHVGTIGLILISCFVAGFIMTLAYQSFAVQEIYHFSPALDKLFATKEWFFAWFAAPIVGLLIFTH